MPRANDMRLGDGPVSEKYQAQMRELCQAIDKFLNPRFPRQVGFILMMFDFAGPKDDHRCNYMSNAVRSEVLQLLKEQVAHFEAQEKEIKT